jgi:NitT/TauT family transport system substrate-binding protein
VIPQARIVYLKDESSGADVVLADRSIRSLGELRGKKVGVMIGDFGEFWLGRLLARAGLSLDEVEVVHTTGSKVPERIRGGEIVAGHTWSPYREEGLALGQVEIATTASDPLTIVDVVLMNGDLLATEPECARHFLRGWSEAVVFWRRHPNEAVRLLKQALPHATSLSLEGITLLDMQESAERMRLERLDELMRAHAVFYRMRGVAVPEAGLAQLLDRRPVEDLLMEKRHP